MLHNFWNKFPGVESTYSVQYAADTACHVSVTCMWACVYTYRVPFTVQPVVGKYCIQLLIIGIFLFVLQKVSVFPIINYEHLARLQHALLPSVLTPEKWDSQFAHFTGFV